MSAMGRNDSWPGPRVPKVCFDRETSGVCEGLFIQRVQFWEGIYMWGGVAQGRPMPIMLQDIDNLERLYWKNFGFRKLASKSVGCDSD